MSQICLLAQLLTGCKFQNVAPEEKIWMNDDEVPLEAEVYFEGLDK